MKLSCKVVEDLLPMYYDGVCSDDSAALIETHLKECPQCKKVLADLQTEIEITEKAVDDLKPLEGIQKKWKKSKYDKCRGEPMCSPQNIESLNNTFHGKEAKPAIPYQLSSLRFQNNL